MQNSGQGGLSRPLGQAEDLNEGSEHALWIYSKNILEEGRTSAKHWCGSSPGVFHEVTLARKGLGRKGR